MSKIPLQKYLRQLAKALVSVIFFSFLSPSFAFGFIENSKDFRIAVLGDSVLWGMGLREENKIHSKLAKWLQTEIFKEKRHVAIPLLLAHARAKIFPEFDKKERLIPAKNFGEMSSGNPSILSQVDLAAETFRRKGVNPEDVELIIVNGGANNLGVKNLVIMLFPNREVIDRAKKYCFDEMQIVLAKIADVFPNARIVVVGYYQVISSETKSAELTKSLFGLVGLRKLGALFNIPFYHERWVRDSLAKKSDYWHQYSDYSLNQVVEELNKQRPIQDTKSQKNLPRAFFVHAPFNPENSYGAPDTYLWKLVGWGKSNDEMRAERQKSCKQEKKRGLDYSFCSKGALGHPNIKGANAYFEAIKNTLVPIIDSFDWLENSENQ